MAALNEAVSADCAQMILFHPISTCACTPRFSLPKEVFRVYMNFLCHLHHSDTDVLAGVLRYFMQKLPYLHKSSAHPFRGFLSPKNRVRIRIDGALDEHAKLETTISLSVGS